jgi:transcriptional regulator with XRE-family HTH domain
MADPLSRATQELGERIRDRRLRLGATQEEVAVGAGVDTTTIGKIERGERNPNLHNLIRIADALQLDAGELISGLTAEMVPPRDSKPSALARLRGKQARNSQVIAAK